MTEPIKKERLRSGGKAISILILGVIIIIGAYLFFSDSSPFKNRTAPQEKIDPNSYQAVFVTNNQVYFGHLENTEGPYVKLTNIYYLQLNRSLQEQKKTGGGEEQEETQQETEKVESDLTLTKLGNELHGPSDAMLINKDHILFYENLKPESKVVQAIQKYESGQQ